MSKAKVNIDKLATEVVKQLDVYRDITVEIMTEAVNETAKATVAELKKTSPRDSGEYAKSWKSKRDKSLKGKWAYSKIVYNDKHYRLTHLLEKGHANVNGGSTAAQPHIAPAEEMAKRLFEETLINKLAEAIE